MNKKTLILLILVTVLSVPFWAYSADKIIVKDGTGTTTRFVVNDEGMVGVGTDTPQAALDTAGGDITVNGADTTGYRLPGLSTPEIGKMNIGYGGSGGGNIDVYSKGHATRPGSFYFIYGGGNFGELRFIHYTGEGLNYNTRMAINKDGYLGLNITYPSYPIHHSSGAYLSAGGVWTNASSREYKENIESLTVEKAMDALKGLNPVTFNYKADNRDKHVGFIAEDVPELVATEDRKSLSPMDIVAVLTSVVKEQQRVNEEQQKTISEMKDEIKELKKELKLKSSMATADYSLR